MSTILLAKELGANPVLLDDYRARKLAKGKASRFSAASVCLKPFTCATI